MGPWKHVTYILPMIAAALSAARVLRGPARAALRMQTPTAAHIPRVSVANYATAVRIGNLRPAQPKKNVSIL